MTEQGQLWDAGPVALRRRGRPRTRSLEPKRRPECSEPGCHNEKQHASGARYCAEHSRAMDKSTFEDVACLRCGAVNHRRRVRVQDSPGWLAWRDFCAACHEQSPLTWRQLSQHRVPVETARAWLLRGAELTCDSCGRQLGSRRPPVVDHDHACCPRKRSCGSCIRGVLCGNCNLGVGHVERLIAQGVPAERLLGYLARGAA